MSSLVGHALAGIAAAQAASGDPKRRGRRRFWALMAIIAVLPDLDVVVFMLFNPPGMVPHRGASHSLLFAAVIALAVALVFGHFLSLSRLRLFGCAFAAYASHLVLDYLMGKGPQVHFFWPISDHGYLSPVQIVPTAYYGLSGRALEQVLLAPATYLGIALELFIFVPLVVLTSRGEARRADLLMFTLAGLVATAAIYN